MKIEILITILLFLTAFFLVGQNLDKPFWGEHDWNGVRYGNIARNYLRYGFWETKFGQVENSGWVRVGEFEYYTHYPPLLPILISLSYKIFGIFEWSTRLIPLLATSASLVLILLIGTSLEDFKRGLIAGLLALATPLVLYFGKNPSHESLTTFFILLSFWGYLSYQKKHKKIFWIIFLVGLIFAQLTAWAAYFMIVALTIYHAIKRDWVRIKDLFLAWLVSILLFILQLVHVFILTGSVSGGGLFESLLQRSGVQSDIQPKEFNLFNYILKLRLWSSIQFSSTLSLLVIIWMMVTKIGFKKNEWPVFVLGLSGLIYISLFSNSVFIHNYLIFYFLPFMALAGSFGVIYISKIKNLGFIGPILPLIFLFLIVLERKDYLLALNGSRSDKLAVEVGKAINRGTIPSDQIVISPFKFSYSAEKFLKFYSDRYLIFLDVPPPIYEVLVIVDQDNGSFTLTKKTKH